MKWCQTHWDALREGIKARRMWRFVPEDAHEACDNITLELQGQGSPFDPLMGSMWQLTSQIMDNIGRSQGPAASIAAFGDPDWCPMCEVQRSYEWWDDPKLNTEGMPRPEWARDAQGWIDGKLDGALAYATEQGFKLDPVQ